MYEKSKRFYDFNFNSNPLNGGFLVAKNGKIIFEQYQGNLHLGENDSIGMHTALHIASTTKTFTAMAILRLAEQGKLKLTDPVKKHLSKFPYKDINIQMLLSHRSALPNYMNVMKPPKPGDTTRISNQQVLEFLNEEKPPLQGKPNQNFSYCNTNYVLLALIIEKLSHQTYAEYLHKNFFEPFGMKNTKVCDAAYQSKNAPSYRWDGSEEAITWLDDTYGDKNICSTPRDLLRWDQALYHPECFKKSTLESAFNPCSFEKKGINNYGLGWRMYCLPKQQTILYHNGWWHGSNASFYRIPNDRITIIAIGNKMNTNIYKLKPLIESLTNIRFNGWKEED